MATRKQKILEDVEELHAACRNGTFPQLQRAHLDDDTLLFEIEGLGEFTACLADSYPNGQTEIYGPDDFEFRSAGSILELILGVLDEVHDPIESPTGSHASSWIVTEMDPESSLDQDLKTARKLFGTAAVQMTQLGTEYWRVRLLVEMRHLNLSPSVCSAWGIDLGRPICVELRLPTHGYSFESVHRGVLQRVQQEGFEDFALESQLVQILGDFCQLCHDGSWKSWASEALHVPTDAEHDSSQLQYEYKKKRLILDAMTQRDFGFLACLARYLQLRVPTVHEYCAICDKPFQQPPMMMRTVCAEELCTYQFSEFGSKITTAETVNHPSEILDLLVCMLTAAAQSKRNNLILDPFPLVQVPEKGQVLHPQQKDFEKLKQILQELQTMRSNYSHSMGASWAMCTSQMSLEAAALLKWTVSSNRSYLAPLEDNQRIEAFRTPFQYLLLSAPPEKETQFQELKKKFGTSFAYHGSSAENWHSILRNGLKNASFTKLMTAGAAHGPGIYLATDSHTSINYTRAQKRAPDEPVALKRQRTGNRFVNTAGGLVMMAVCEVILDPEKLKRPTGGIWVATTEELVCTRFFLVFAGVPEGNVKIPTVEQDLRTLAEKVRVF